jgi:hypothetical protein
MKGWKERNEGENTRYHNKVTKEANIEKVRRAKRKQKRK